MIITEISVSSSLGSAGIKNVATRYKSDSLCPLFTSSTLSWVIVTISLSALRSFNETNKSRINGNTMARQLLWIGINLCYIAWTVRQLKGLLQISNRDMEIQNNFNIVYKFLQGMYSGSNL